MKLYKRQMIILTDSFHIQDKNKYKILCLPLFLILMLLSGCTLAGATSSSSSPYESTSYSGSDLQDIINKYGIDIVVDPYTGESTKCLEFNINNFDGFYYDSENDVSTEVLRIYYNEDLDGRTIDEYSLEYLTTINTIGFKGKFDELPYYYHSYGGYPVLALFGEQYIPIKSPNILAKLFLDSNEIITVPLGNSTNLGNGFTLKVKEIVNGNKVWLELYRNNKFVDDRVVADSPVDNSTWWYDRDVASENDIVVFGVNIKEINPSSVTIDGLWLIDYENILEIEVDEEFGNLKVDLFDLGSISMRNEVPLTLSSGATIQVTDKFFFEVADSSILNFKLISDKYLAMKYLPSLRFNQDEEYYPITVEEFLEESSLKGTYHTWFILVEDMFDAAFSLFVGDEKKYSYEPYKLVLKGDEKDYKDISTPAVYVNIDEFYDEKNELDLIGIQYWWLSYYNPHEIWIDHEGDWEHITVYVNKNTGVLEYVVYSQHYDGECLTTDQINSIQETHPIVYVADGSHASYPNFGSGKNLDTYLGNGQTFQYKDFEGNVYFFSELINTHYWPEFDGRWGDTYGSPKTPSVQEKFNPKMELTSQRRELYSPAYLCAIDEYGRRVGYNESTGEIDMEIPEAYYSGPDEHPQVLSVDDLNLNVTFYMIPKDGGGECNISAAVNNFQEKYFASFENITIGENTTVFSNTSDIKSLNIDTNNDGEIDQIIEAPSISYSANRTKIIVGESISFDATSDPEFSNLTYVWDFGDNTTANTEDVNHTYDVSGTFYPSLTVRTNEEAVASYSTCIEVESLNPPSIPPWSDFSANSVSGVKPFTVQFNDQSLNATSLEWDFGDGSALSSEQNPVHVYTKEGKYTVSLNASSSEGYNIETKVDYITVSTESSSTGGSSSSSGGGSGTSGEAFENIAFKDVKTENIVSGLEISYTFHDEQNAIEYINFSALRNRGRISTTIEVLENRSALVDESAPGLVYSNLNIWVGKSGFATEDNIADPVIGFCVAKDWLTENDIDENSIALYRHSEGKWNALNTKKVGEDDSYIYFEAETSGFSPFAIVGFAEEDESASIRYSTPESASIQYSTPSSEEDISAAEDEDIQPEPKGIPWISTGSLILVLVGVHLLMRKRG